MILRSALRIIRPSDEFDGLYRKKRSVCFYLLEKLMAIHPVVHGLEFLGPDAVGILSRCPNDTILAIETSMKRAAKSRNS